ncbi:MAG: DUF3108 domain-containing protein, partial [Bacteriovoracales bacterium]|nr:DUF3108 domain-containing protein [Bacteriovoracales bacterium]
IGFFMRCFFFIFFVLFFNLNITEARTPGKNDNELQKLISKNKDFKDYPKEYLKNYHEHSSLWSKILPKIFHGEEMVLEIKYLWVKAGRLVIKTMSDRIVNSRKVHHIVGEVSSAPFYRKVYKIDDRIETFLDVKRFVPVRYFLIQRESKQKVDDHQFFDLDRLKTSFTYRKEKRGKITKKRGEVFIPSHFQDFFSAFQFIRALPFVKKKTHIFPLVSRGKVSNIRVESLKKESIILLGKTYKALKFKAMMRPWNSTEEKKERAFSIWLSDDKVRKILKFDAKVKLGRVQGHLVSYQEGVARKGPGL